MRQIPYPRGVRDRGRDCAASRSLFIGAAAAALRRLIRDQLVDLGPEPGRRVSGVRERVREGESRASP